MRSSPVKWVLLLMIVAIGWIIIRHIFHNKAVLPSPPPAAETIAVPSAPPAARHTTPDPKTTSPDDDVTEVVPVPRVDPEKIAECLAAHPRDAANLLAAFHLAKDTNYLNDAVTNFPDDPRVQ